MYTLYLTPEADKLSEWDRKRQETKWSELANKRVKKYWDKSDYTAALWSFGYTTAILVAIGIVGLATNTAGLYITTFSIGLVSFSLFSCFMYGYKRYVKNMKDRERLCATKGIIDFDHGPILEFSECRGALDQWRFQLELKGLDSKDSQYSLSNFPKEARDIAELEDRYHRKDTSPDNKKKIAAMMIVIMETAIKELVRQKKSDEALSRSSMELDATMDYMQEQYGPLPSEKDSEQSDTAATV